MYYIIFILALFSSVGFFNYHGMLSDQMQRGFFYAVSSFALLMAATERKVRLREIEYPRYLYCIVLGSIFVSILMANVYHGQNLSQSIVSTLPYIYSYLYLYILLKLQLSERQIIKVFMVACLLSIPVYFCNLLSYPQQVFGIENSEGADFSRGMLRVYVVFIEVFVLILFYAIQRWRSDRRKMWLTCVSVCIIMIILSLTRQIIVVALIFAILFLLKGTQLKSKVFTLVICACVGWILMTKVPIFKTMIELSDAQAELYDEKEDVRVRAWRYYTYENQVGIETVLFGNGVPSLGISRYGIQFEQDTEETHCYTVDVGWAGFFYYFGIIGVVALLILLIKSAYYAHHRGRDYLTYWLCYIMITAVASGPILFYFQILILMTGLYLVYAPDEQDGSHNTELQQC